MSSSASTSAPLEVLPAAQVAQLRSDGYTAVDHFLDAETLKTLRDFYDKIVNGEIKLPGDRQLGGVTRQVMHPRLAIDFFKDNPGLRRGLAIASQVLGGEAELCFDMLIYKPPMHPKPTPWHQDFAYNTMPFQKEGTPMNDGSLQFWVALDDVDFANGCMHFVGGHHFQGLKQHFVYAGDPTDEGRLLATDAFGNRDLPNEGVACPLPAGGCTIHFYGTPHYTPPNITPDRGRRAYIFNVRRR
ncbi:MAG TPA: phytanoyl-CoA dioxygenase family protein [Tepidisphaeraceae bacterium]